MQSRRKFLKQVSLIAGGAAAQGLWPAGRAEAADDLPNIVFMMADDLGYGDVHANNPESKIPTPNFDRIARQGMRFTDAHSGSAVCTPTRYGVVTGRYSWRTRMKSGVLNGYSAPLIEPGRATVASALKGLGYHTACIGKWHLGMELPKKGDGKQPALDYAGKIEGGPRAVGFDYNYNVIASLDMPPYVYVENEGFVEAGTETYPGSAFPEFIRSGPKAPGFDFDGCLDRLADTAARYIAERGKARKEGGAPFFLYFPLTAPHKPVMPAQRFQGASDLGDYGDFIMQVDDTVGRVERALRTAGVSDNTLFIVTSDNGSFMYRLRNAPERHLDASGEDHVTQSSVQAFDQKHHKSNYIWRGTKADIWDGGHRVPFIAQWPARVQGGATCDTPICHTDFMATAVEAAGGALAAGAGEDSFSIVPLLLEKTAKKRPPVVHHSGNGTYALRDGQWKFILGMGSGGRGQPSSRPWSRPYQLYNMKVDPSETINLIHLAKHQKVVDKMMQWAEDLGILANKPKG